MRLEKVKHLARQYREQILYLFFGGCTTLVNIVVYSLCTRLLGMDVVSASAVGWLLSVLFAYVTNRGMVFESRVSGAKGIALEMGKFVVGRVATGLMDIAIMYVSVDLLGANDMVMKILSNVLVIILNYVISKLMVFRKK